jgi:hypothetical protein
MNRLARVGVVLVAGGTMALTASPAGAHSGEPAPDDGGDWVPIESIHPDFYDPIEFSACGTTITMTTGDVADVEGREATLPNGTMLFEARGGMTVDLTRHDTGQVIDELDISGPVSERISPDGTHVTSTLDGPSILFPALGPIDEAAFEAAGLPDLAYYRKGTVTFHAVVDPETGELVSEEIDNDAKRVHDLCTWFDDERGDRHDRHHDWKDHD